MNKLKQNRIASFIAIIVIYVFATVVGVTVYRALSLDWRLALLIAEYKKQTRMLLPIPKN